MSNTKGWDALIKKVERIEKGIVKAQKKAAETWVEEDFKPYAQSIAPVRSGEFRDSIDGKATDTRVTVFATAPHSRWVEEGTSKMAAQPTLKPALEATKGKLLKRMKDAIKKVTK